VGRRHRGCTFHEATRRRYLNYALSVITARALPDVRDGLKPVQRRILYTMRHDLHLDPAAKPKKCAAIVGDCMGSTTRTATARSTRRSCAWRRTSTCATRSSRGTATSDPSMGPPAAMRYTEARLQPLATELLDDLQKETVEFRDNYDGTTRSRASCPRASRSSS